jgi:hypothetical protein
MKGNSLLIRQQAASLLLAMEGHEQFDVVQVERISPSFLLLIGSIIRTNARQVFMGQTIQLILMIIGAATVGTWLSQRISAWSDKREYENSRNESNGHVTFSEWKQERERERKGQDLNQPTQAGKEQSSHAMGINELTLRDEYNGLLKSQVLRGEKVSNALPSWPYWLQQQLDKRGMTIFDLDPQVQQHEARKAGREKEWLEAREAARKARN